MSLTPKDTFTHEFTRSLDAGSFVRLTLSVYHGIEPELEKLLIRPVVIRDVKKLACVYRYKTKDVTKNYSLDEGCRLVAALLGDDFRSANLFTLEQDHHLEYGASGVPRLRSQKPTFAKPPSSSHDRAKQRLIDPLDNVYLRELGVVNAQGAVRTAQGDKFRQINKFLEVVAHLLQSSPLSSRSKISVVDMGSGKGYLTFGLYDYLINTLHRDAEIVGVEVRGDLVAASNAIASHAGFTGLHFEESLIDDYEVRHPDILIALHACNTATDDAIYKGIVGDAAIIICAPCCHKEIRPQLVAPQNLAAALRSGVYAERVADIVTDTLRTLYLELCGYKTTVMEFVPLEHTAKNVMITALKHNRRVDREKILTEIATIRESFGIQTHRLGALLEPMLKAQSSEAALADAGQGI